MTVQQLKYILKVAEVGSITEAAKLLFISQPSLSNSIKETEKDESEIAHTSFPADIAASSKAAVKIGRAHV